MKKNILALAVLCISFSFLSFAQAQTADTLPPDNILTPPPAPEQLTAASKIDLQNAFERFKSVKGELKDAQNKLRGAVKEKRTEIQQLIKEKREDYLLKAVDVLIAHSENLKKRVMNNKTVYGELEQSIIAEINNDIVKLNELKNKVSSAQTLEELNQIAKQIKIHRKDIYNLKIRRLLLLANIGRFEKAVILNAENRSIRIADKIVQLKNSGKDVIQLENLLNQANAKIQEAKNALKDLRNNVNSQEITDVKMDEVRKKLNDIKDIIKTVYDLFQQIATLGNSL